jgi:hypothetical protein
MNRVSRLTAQLGSATLERPGAAAAAAAKSYSGIAAAAEVARIRAEDPHAPHYHFIEPDPAFPFDPNGTIYWKGRYHLFYILDPGHRAAQWWPLLGPGTPAAPTCWTGGSTRRHRSIRAAQKQCLGPRQVDIFLHESAIQTIFWAPENSLSILSGPNRASR